MIADDAPEIRQLIAQWLQTRGHSVACLASGNDAIRRMGAEPFDPVIADVLMAEGDGLDVIRELKHQQLPSRGLAISGG
jgi:CheY-like chemotaxis protein